MATIAFLQKKLHLRFYQRMGMISRVIGWWLAVGLGLGLLPLAPGTWGSLGAVCITLLFYQFVPQFLCLFLWCIFLLTLTVGIFVSGAAEAGLGERDPSCVVIDEVAGQFLTFLIIPLSIPMIILGFFLFRFFDIAKPFPCRRAESLPGGLGIMMDDVVAGLYAGVLAVAVAQIWAMFFTTIGV